MIETVEGIVVSEVSYGDTSKIINIITKEYGIIGCMAKGAKTLKSELRSISSKLTYAKFQIKYRKDKLSTLISADIIDSFKNIKKDIKKISYTTFIVELSEQVIKQTNNNIFELLIASLKKIDEGYDAMVITNILELKYLNYLGVMPILDECSVCGSKTGIATLSSYKGGYICNKCLTNEGIVSEKTIKMIRMFAYVDISKISKLDISERTKLEINRFLDEYYDRYTGLYLNSKSFLKNLNKLSKEKKND